MYERFSGTKIGGRNNEVNRMRFHCTCFVYRFSIRLEVMTVKRIVILTFLIRAFCKYPFFFHFFFRLTGYKLCTDSASHSCLMPLVITRCPFSNLLKLTEKFTPHFLFDCLFFLSYWYCVRALYPEKSGKIISYPICQLLICCLFNLPSSAFSCFHISSIYPSISQSLVTVIQ